MLIGLISITWVVVEISREKCFAFCCFLAVAEMEVSEQRYYDFAPVAHLDRATAFEAVGGTFESCQAHFLRFCLEAG